MTLVLRPRHRDPREFTLADDHYLPPIALVPSMFCPMSLTLHPRYIIITQLPTILHITRIYPPLHKIFSLIFPYLLLLSRTFLPLDVLLLFQLLITSIIFTFNPILLLINEIKYIHAIPNAYNRFLQLFFMNLTLYLLYMLLHQFIYKIMLSLLPRYIYIVLVLFAQLQLHYDSRYNIHYSKLLFLLILLLHYLLQKMSHFLPANMTGDLGIRRYVL